MSLTYLPIPIRCSFNLVYTLSTMFYGTKWETNFNIPCRRVFQVVLSSYNLHRYNSFKFVHIQLFVITRLSSFIYSYFVLLVVHVLACVISKIYDCFLKLIINAFGNPLSWSVCTFNTYLKELMYGGVCTSNISIANALSLY